MTDPRYCPFIKNVGYNEIDGAFAEYCLVDSASTVRSPDELSFEQAGHSIAQMSKVDARNTGCSSGMCWYERMFLYRQDGATGRRCELLSSLSFSQANARKVLAVVGLDGGRAAGCPTRKSKSTRVHARLYNDRFHKTPWTYNTNCISIQAQNIPQSDKSQCL